MVCYMGFEKISWKIVHCLKAVYINLRVVVEICGITLTEEEKGKECMYSKGFIKGIELKLKTKKLGKTKKYCECIYIVSILSFDW